MIFEQMIFLEHNGHSLTLSYNIWLRLERTSTIGVPQGSTKCNVLQLFDQMSSHMLSNIPHTKWQYLLPLSLLTHELNHLLPMSPFAISTLPPLPSLSSPLLSHLCLSSSPPHINTSIAITRLLISQFCNYHKRGAKEIEKLMSYFSAENLSQECKWLMNLIMSENKFKPIVFHGSLIVIAMVGPC